MEVIVYTRPDDESHGRIKEILEAMGVYFKEQVAVVHGTVSQQAPPELDLSSESGPLTSQAIRARITDEKLLQHCDVRRCLAPSSYALRVGSYFDTSQQAWTLLQDGERIIIAPEGLVLIETFEEVNLPDDIQGTMYLRSSYALSGFVAWFCGLIEPGYSGTLKLALHNPTDSYLPVSGHEPICHMVFQQIAGRHPLGLARPGGPN